MSAGTLQPGVVDVFLRALDQAPGDRSGPSGRLTSLKNTVVTQYNAGEGKPQRITVKQRNGFTSLVTTGHSSTTGAAATVAWSNPELLSTLGSQLLSIANAIPRVYDGTDWTHYADERVISNVLTESVFHTSQHTIQATDSAYIGGVTCSVWSEQLTPFTTTAKIFAGFRDDDGTWVRPPFELTTSFAGIFMCRVVADQSGTTFWVVNNDVSNSFDIRCFSVNGEQLASTTLTKPWSTNPGYWDVTRYPGGGIMIAQPLHDAVDATDGVKFTKCTRSGGTITKTTTDNTTAHCRGPVAWLTNDLGDSKLYLATIGLGEGLGGKLWAYQITPATPATAAHEYNFAINCPGGAFPDSLIGFTQTANDPDAPGVPRVYVSFTVLSLPAQTIGPPYDPQLRYSKVYYCDPNDTVVFVRQNNYTCQVSRAFAHDGEYYSINYYQSGSGRTLATTQVNVDFTAGDYMLGAPQQPLTVVPGDFTAGAPWTFHSTGPVTNSGSGTAGITGTDTVAIVTSDGSSPSYFGYVMAAQGTRLLKWTFANPIAGIGLGGQLVIAGSAGVTGANSTWQMVAPDQANPTTVFYTQIANTINGGSVVAGTFTAGGTATVAGQTAYPCDYNDLQNIYSETTKSFVIGGSMVVTGNANSANNGTKTVTRIGVQTSPLVTLDAGMFYGRGCIWIATGSEVTGGGFTAVVHALLDNQWSFSREQFDDVDIGSDLVIDGDSVGGNNGIFPITDAPSIHNVTVVSTATIPEFFGPTIPTAEIDLEAQTPYTFFLQDLTVDYSLIGATLVLSFDTTHTQNNGSYTIKDIDPDPSHHIVYCVPANGATGQRNQFFHADEQSVVVIKQTNVNPEYQPCWLIVPLTGTKPVVGRFEYGIAYADWKVEGFPIAGPDLYPLHVTSLVTTAAGLTWVLPYRAVSFTVGQTIVTASGQVINAAVSSSASTVGVKQFALSNDPGQATQFPGSLLLPGPMCGEFTASGFHEQGVNFGFEAPFAIEQDTSSAGVALTKKAKYQYVAVAEVTDEDGDRVFSLVSPPLNVPLSGDNDVIVLAGRMLQPLDTAGAPVDKHFGVTNWTLLGISLYRTVIVDGVPTAERHKITLDLAVNGLAPISDSNASGFSFPDEFTWHYRDENIDAAAINGEVLYTDKGYLPRFPAPAQRQGVLWKDRAWVIGYDGAVWMSGEKREGDATWFFPLFRFPQAVQDEPVSLAPMDDYLLVFCRGGESVWYIPAAQFPDSTGRNGTLPAMVKTTFTNGGTGFSIPVHAGVAYSSTAGGVWLVTRGLVNQYLSQPIQADIIGNGLTITGLAIDENQRLHVATGTNGWFVYDQVVQLWSFWTPATSSAKFPAVLGGRIAFQDNANVWVYDTGSFADNLGGTLFGCPPDVTLSSLNFANVRGLKSVWAMQLVGKYKGAHRLNAILSYPDDDPANPTTFGPFTPDGALPYLMEINPMVEQASSYGLRVYADFVGVTSPADSFELELISCEVGVESRSGLNKFPDNRRIRSNG